MNYAEAVEYIHSLGKFGLPASLDRIKEVCKKLGNPQNDFKSIHIAGTNGKGSTAKMISSILSKSGLIVGLFISPYIVCFNERIQINGEYISDNDLVSLTKMVKNTGVPLNEFEFITAIGFLFFKEKCVDIAVFEVGLGGRLDATNILGDVKVSVITAIGLDHTAILGETVEKIAAEKCGIIRKGVPVVTICNQNEKALSVIKNNTEFITVPETPQILKADMSGCEFLYSGKKYALKLLGLHQIYNAATAIEAVKALPFTVPERTVFDGLYETSFPARLEVVSSLPLVIIDGAHNENGGSALADFLKTVNGGVTLICAMMKDKDEDKFIETVSGYVKTFIAVSIDNPRCERAATLGKIAARYIENTVSFDDLTEAIRFAEKTDYPVFVAGSLYLAAKVREYYKK